MRQKTFLLLKKGESRNTPRDLGIPIAVSAAAWPSSRTTIPHRSQCRGSFVPCFFFSKTPADISYISSTKKCLPKLNGDWDDLRSSSGSWWVMPSITGIYRIGAPDVKICED